MDDKDLKIRDQRIEELLERAQDLYTRGIGNGSHFDPDEHRSLIDEIDALMAEMRARRDGT